jgi:hypothetical protein
VKPLTVDLTRRDHLDGDPRRAVEDRTEELFSLLRSDLLRVVQLREGTNAVVAKRLVIEQDAGDDERPCERSASGLVSPGDEASAEPSVEPQQPLTRLR